MRTAGIVGAWCLIGVGVGLMFRAIFILGAPKSKEDYE